ncbi:hypothetical protein [Sulfurimonas autotrophica]|uniref:Lipoprotein n=1 Tax=Sulfurimonas autotrophica (strain ATCC BAA-671 / DSM 16294 / JCM 11897 / OK10) TaxID=563040 RepID=E0UTA6_SULAO|nr:hypothetical protein [Sulfurimonas autotrophica]ADN08209.1 hypothetical protein Saut_0160 [Sulfurimonas autotrophica DSM 16294]
MLKKIISTGVVAASILLSGCGVTTSYMTDLHVPDKNKPVVVILVDQDSTSLGGVMVGSVVRTNYMYSFAVAAQTTTDAGYKYFTIIEPVQLTKQFTNRKVTNIQEAYDACDDGEGSFIAGFNPKYNFTLGHGKYNCDVMTNQYTDATLTGGSVVHKSVRYVIEMHNEPRANSNATFNAQEVLDSKLVSSLNREYFVKSTR